MGNWSATLSASGNPPERIHLGEDVREKELKGLTQLNHHAARMIQLRAAGFMVLPLWK
jgi:hypothetical protein